MIHSLVTRHKVPKIRSLAIQGKTDSAVSLARDSRGLGITAVWRMQQAMPQKLSACWTPAGLSGAV